MGCEGNEDGTVWGGDRDGSGRGCTRLHPGPVPRAAGSAEASEVTGWAWDFPERLTEGDTCSLWRLQNCPGKTM